ncbi:MAG: hypothetical protein ABW215_09525 [Kibdelosporangium sp.]
MPSPDESQAAVAAGYLRGRRLLYPVLFLAAPAALSGLANGPVRQLAPLVVALPIAAVRPVRGPRVATLTRRHRRDFVPTWAVGLLLGLATLAVLLGAAGWAAQPWADQVAAVIPAGDSRSPEGITMNVAENYHAEITQPVWPLVFVGVLVGLVIVLGVVRLAVRRGSVADLQVDGALRMRSARVAVGIGIAWMASMTTVASQRLEFLRAVQFPVTQFPPPPGWPDYPSATRFLGLLLLLVAAAGWIWVANPPRRLAAVG